MAGPAGFRASSRKNSFARRAIVRTLRHLSAPPRRAARRSRDAVAVLLLIYRKRKSFIEEIE